MVDWKEHITVSLNVCHGRPCIKGTRVMVSVILDNLADGVSIDELKANYPSLTTESIKAAQSYAAWLINEEDVIPLKKVG